MATEIIMPVFGFTQEESEIVSWLVKEGDEVEKGDPIAEVTTDKINMEVEAPASGIFGGIQYQVGEVVPVTSVIAFILDPGETPPIVTPKPAASHGQTEPQGDTGAPAPERSPSKSAPVTPVAARMAAATGVDVEQVRGTGSGGRVTRKDVEAYLQQPEEPGTGKVRATPAARRVARDRGIDLSAVGGSGPHGRIQEADVQGYQPARQPVPALETEEELVHIPFSNMRRTIAANLQRSAQEAPHIYFQADVELDALMDLTARGNARLDENAGKITVTAALAKAVAWTLERHQALNSHIGKNEIIRYRSIHLGIAVALDEGLIVPVLKNAGNKNIRVISAEIRDLASRARSGKLKPEDLRGGTFTISNLGMFGIDRFTAIINPPEVGILAVGRARRQFVPDRNGQPVVRQVVTLTLSVDHRVIDGAVAAAFMEELRDVVEHPDLMIL